MAQTLDTGNPTKVLLTSMALYLAACALPALVLHNRAYLDNTHSVWQSYRSIRGINLLFTGLAFGWARFNFTAFANVPLWISWIQFGRGKYKAAASLSVAAMILSIETLQLAFQPYIYDEGASVKGFLAWPHIGFLCWIASMAVIYFQSKRLAQTLDAPQATN